MSMLSLNMAMWRRDYAQPFTPAQQAILATPIPAKTRQELFDGTVRHLAKQRQASTIPGTTLCRYRGVKGMQCGIGCHIADAVYSREMEGSGVPGDNDQNVWGWVVCHAAGIRTDAVRLLAIELQSVHDEADAAGNGTPQLWFDRLKGVATKFKLSKKVFREPEVIEGFKQIEEMYK